LELIQTKDNPNTVAQQLAMLTLHGSNGQWKQFQWNRFVSNRASTLCYRLGDRITQYVLQTERTDRPLMIATIRRS
jgi:hypothetical protein